jgi:putative effector of murein hydrolase LrgA (UPF0299 family)
MLALYRLMLYLYPAAYHGEYGEEMLEVLSEVQTEMRSKSALAGVGCAAREAAGLLYGALQEHLRPLTAAQDRGRFSFLFLGGRVAMRSEFRFPKATVGLMLVILAAVMFTIEKAKAISASIPHANPSVGHIHPSQITILPMLLVALASAIGAGVIGWAILFALRRSGIQQLSEVNPSAGQGSGK